MKKTGKEMNAQVSHTVVGLIPAAGSGTRIAPLPMSKELFPIGFHSDQGGKSPRPKVVAQYLLEKFAKAGIRNTFIVIRQGKWDIPAYFGDGGSLNMHLAYLLMGDPFGPPFTLDQAYPFIQDKVIAFGFPDILFDPEDVFQQLLSRQRSSRSDIVLALYPAHDPAIMDMVDVSGDGTIRAIDLKPGVTTWHYAWVCAVWTPVFTEFMHQFLQGKKKMYGRRQKTGKERDAEPQDLTVGAVIQAAVKKGLKVTGVTFPRHTYLDIGTPQDLIKSVQLYSVPSASGRAPSR